MKEIIAVFVIMFGILSVQSQTNALPFLWHEQTMGVEFEHTNLTISAKSAIRDDISYSMSLIPITNVVFTILSPTNSYYGKYSGFVTFSCVTPINYCEGILCYYKTSGDVINFQFDPKACSNYISAISLTNQYVGAISSFSNFLNQVKSGFSVANMTLTQKRALFWNPMILNDWEQQSGNNFEQELTTAIPSAPTPDVISPLPPILAFSVHDDILEGGNPPLLCCELKSWREGDWARKVVFVYVDGSWRFCLP